MAQGSLIPLAKQLIPTDAWAPGVGFKIYTYAAGTLTPKATYQDNALTVANANPIIADARGEYVAYGSGVYRIIAKDASDVTIWDRDNVDAGGYNGTDIGTIFQGQVSHVVDSISALRLIDKSKYTRCYVTGNSSVGDGGVGNYWLDPSDTTSSDNGWAVVVASDGGRWKRLNKISQAVTTSTDIASQFIERNTNHTGGTTGFVNSALRVNHTVNAGVTNYEWAVTAVMQNYSDTGENVGIYGQGNMRANGGTWGGVMEATDASFTGSTGKQNLVGLEVDCYFNDADSAANRYGISVVAGDAQFNRTGSAGSSGDATYGILVAAQAGGASCQFKNGVVVNSATDTAFQSGAACINAFKVLSTASVGFDTSGATITTAAFRMGVGQSIAFDGSGTNQILNDGAGIAYKVSGTTKSRLNANGGIELNGLATVIPGSYSSGSTTPVLNASKPGANTTIGTWLSVVINGTQYWIPAWNN